MVFGVQVHPLRVVHTRDLLVGVDRCQDTADISLRENGKVLGLLDEIQSVYISVCQNLELPCCGINLDWRIKEQSSKEI